MKKETLVACLVIALSTFTSGALIAASCVTKVTKPDGTKIVTVVKGTTCSVDATGACSCHD